MLKYILILALYVLGIIVCSSIVPLCMLIVYKLKNDEQTTISYIFSRELFETDYPNMSFFQYWNEQYEMKRAEELCKPLP